MIHKTRQCQIEAATRYNKKNSQTLNVRLNNKTDKDIIEAISLHQSKSSYIKNLIREDLKRKESTRCFLSDLENNSFITEKALIEERFRNCRS